MYRSCSTIINEGRSAGYNRRKGNRFQHLVSLKCLNCELVDLLDSGRLLLAILRLCERCHHQHQFMAKSSSHFADTFTSRVITHSNCDRLCPNFHGFFFLSTSLFCFANWPSGYVSEIVSTQCTTSSTNTKESTCIWTSSLYTAHHLPSSSVFKLHGLLAFF